VEADGVTAYSQSLPTTRSIGNSSDHDGVKFRCLCVNCLNKRRLDVNKIREHLLCDGFYDLIQL